MRRSHAPAIALLTLLALVAAASLALGQDNHTPETAKPLTDGNYISEYVNGSDDTKEYWYHLDVDRGDTVYIYFYGTGEPYHRCRMLYTFYGPDGYEQGDAVHAESWYRQKQSQNDYSDQWHWICPRGGRFYIHFYAAGEAVGNFHCNVTREVPDEIFRKASDYGQLWWGGVTDQNRYDTWKVWLKATEATVEGVDVTVTFTAAHRLILYAYDLVDTHSSNELNRSYCYLDETDGEERLRFTASYTGWYYIVIYYGSGAGSEDYHIVTREHSAPNDGDNDLDNATHVRKTSTIQGSLSNERDMHDWFKVELIKGDVIGISMALMDPHNPRYEPDNPNFWNYWEIQVYDPYMRRVNNGYDTNYIYNQAPGDSISDLPIQPKDLTVNGTYYIRASFSSSYGYYFDEENTTGHDVASCRYVLQVTIPNRPPAINASALEDVIMLEDSTWWDDIQGNNVSSIDMWQVFIDPEDGEMVFSARGDQNLTATVKDDRLSLKPRRDWFGEANVTLRVDDDSGNTVVTTLHVVVVPVNDQPRAGEPLSVEFLEDDASEENRTFGLYALFSDIDDEDAHNLTFAMVTATGVSVAIDQTTGNATVTLPADVNGMFFLTFNATDTHGEMVQGEVDVTVSPVNDAPKARGGEAVFLFEEGFMLDTFDLADLLYDPDEDEGLRWYVHYVNPWDEDNLNVDNEAKDPLNSVLVITPAVGKLDWFGTVDLRAVCVDPGGLEGEKALSVVIANTPDAPSIAAYEPSAGVSFGEGDAFSFNITRVVDPDGSLGTLNYTFRLKGPEDLYAKEVQNGSEASYVMVTDYESEGRYELTALVVDDTGLECPTPVTWEVTVIKTNRRPTVTLVSPAQNAVFKEGEWVELTAEVDDPDPEDVGGLVVEWYEGADRLGTGRSYSIRSLSPGDHQIAVVVTDPTGDYVEETFTVTVKKGEESPGPASVMALAALLLAALVGGASRRLS